MAKPVANPASMGTAATVIASSEVSRGSPARALAVMNAMVIQEPVAAPNAPPPITDQSCEATVRGVASSTVHSKTTVVSKARLFIDGP